MKCSKSVKLARIHLSVTFPDFRTLSPLSIHAPLHPLRRLNGSLQQMRGARPQVLQLLRCQLQRRLAAALRLVLRAAARTEVVGIHQQHLQRWQLLQEFKGQVGLEDAQLSHA